MHGRIEKTNEHLPGVKCVVNSCYYHAAGDYCSAEKIEIRPPQAQDTEETDCATFIKSS
ncbi:MAG: DUF1540 domain-containing protein [Caldicoprobacterales bacterium]|jgi:hypothetical protein|nr:DUF1540 domain-containing protein [Clostridiales bacterium]